MKINFKNIKPNYIEYLNNHVNMNKDAKLHTELSTLE